MKRQYPWFNLRGGSTTPTNWADNIFGLDHGIEIYEEPPPAEQSSSTGTFMEPVVDTEDRPPTIYEEQVRMFPGATEEDLTSMTIDKSRYDTSAAIGSDGSNFYTTRVYVPDDDDDEEHDEGEMGEDNLGSPSDEEDDDVKAFKAEPIDPKNSKQPALAYNAKTFKEFKNIIIYLKDIRAPVGMIIVVIAHKSLKTNDIMTSMNMQQEHKCNIEGPYKGKTDLYYLVSTLAEYKALDHRKKYYNSPIYRYIDKNIFINDWEMYNRRANELFRYQVQEDKSYFINDVLEEAAQLFSFRYYNYVRDIVLLFNFAKLPGGSIILDDQSKEADTAAAEEEKPIPTPTSTETTGEEIAKAMEKQDEHPMVTTTIETEDD